MLTRRAFVKFQLIKNVVWVRRLEVWKHLGEGCWGERLEHWLNGV